MLKDESWLELWSRLEPAYEAAARTVVERNPRVTWIASYWGNDALPFVCYLSMRITADSIDEDFVVGLTVERQEESLQLSSDLSTGEGTIIFDGPSAEVSVAHFGPDWLDAVAEQHQRFLLSVMDYLIRNTV